MPPEKNTKENSSPLNKPQPELKNTVKKRLVSAIRTYEDDMAGYVQDGKVSKATIVMAEQRKRLQEEAKSKNEEREYKSSQNIIKISVALLFGSVLIIASIFFILKFTSVNQTENRITENSNLKNAILDNNLHIKINTDDKLNLEIKKQITDFIENPVNLNLYKIGEFQTIQKNESGNEEYVSVPRLFEILGLTPPQRFTNNLNGKYLFGLMGSSDKPVPFMLFEYNNFDLVFTELLNWESYMIREMNDIFFKTLGKNDFIVVGESLGNYTYNPQDFKDIVVFNRDSRAIIDNNNNILFLYSFIDENKILFTSEKFVVEEMVKKLQLQKIIR